MTNNISIKSSMASYSKPYFNNYFMNSSMASLRWCFLILLLVIVATPAEGTITLFENGMQFKSRPAAFGMTFEKGSQHAAHLRYLPDDVHLCDGIVDEGERQDGGEREDDDDEGRPFSRKHYQKRNLIRGSRGIRTNRKRKISSRHDRENDMMLLASPVALLAKRGQCSYETKAKVASRMTFAGRSVRFVVVYNDDANEGSHLITMLPSDPDGEHDLWTEMGFLFVSHQTGLDLTLYIDSQPPSILEQGGPLILIDSAKWPSYTAAFIVIFFGVLGFILISFVSSDQVFVLPQRPGRNRTPHRTEIRRITHTGLRLMTMEEVDNLPTRIYVAPDTSSNPNTCPSSSSSCSSYSPDPSSPTQQNSSETHTSCSICLEDYTQGERIRVLPCQHTFHSECIFPWLTERSPTCPLCKADFQTEKDDIDLVDESFTPETNEIVVVVA